MKKREKKGLSGIVTTILIVLIALSAVIILWRFTHLLLERKSLEISGEKIGLMLVSLSLQKNSVYVNEAEGKLQLSIMRGADNVNFSSLKIVVLGERNGETESEFYITTNPPLALETKTYILNIAGLANIKKISVYPMTPDGKTGIGVNYNIKETDKKTPEQGWANVPIINPEGGKMLTCYYDGDNDYYTNGDSAVSASCPARYYEESYFVSLSLIDCNDSNALINPGAEEICENNIDEDCDGQDALCVKGCGILNQTNKIYTLQNSISTNLTCFTISANNITLDMNGFRITGDDSVAFSGIYSSGYSNLIIKNGEIYDFRYGVYLSSSSNNIITSNTVNSNNYYGVYLYSSSNNTITSNTVNSNRYGISLSSSSNNNTITSNTVNSNNYYGFYLSLSSNNIITSNTVNSNNYHGFYLSLSSNNNTITSNTANSNKYGVYLYSSSDNALANNTLSKNREIAYMNTYTNNFNSNTFLENLNSLSSFSTASQEGSVGNRIDFNLTMRYVNGSICPTCNYKLDLYPSESSLQTSSSNGLITGNFTPTRIGIYSLRFNITDMNNNSEIRKYIYLINATSGLVNYYFRNTSATHGQPTTSTEDCGSLLFEKPTSPENRWCGGWIQFSLDILPDYLFGTYKQINYSIWYSTNAFANNFTGVQRYATYDEIVNYNVSVPGTTKSFGTFNFSVNWVNDYFWTWYWIAIKLKGSSPYIYSNATAPSYANITYTYSNTPAIKQISNENIDLLSATMASETATSAEIILRGKGTSNIVIKMPVSRTYSCSGCGCSGSQAGTELTLPVSVDGKCTLNING